MALNAKHIMDSSSNSDRTKWFFQVYGRKPHRRSFIVSVLERSGYVPENFRRPKLRYWLCPRKFFYSML